MVEPTIRQWDVSGTMRVLLFHNPAAGTQNHSMEELRGLLEAVGLMPSYCSTKDENFGEMLSRSADLVVAAGGDGTVAKVITALPNRNTPIAILPLGTTNNIAQSLGIAGPLQAIAAGWDIHRTRPMDIGLATGTWGRRRFVEAVGLGSLTRAMAELHAHRVESADKLQLARNAFRRVLARAGTERLGAAVDGRKLPTELLALEVMNTAYAGPSLPLAAFADAGDGLLDVVSIDASQRADMLRWLEAPHHAIAPPLNAEKGRKVVIACNGMGMRLDNDFLPVTDHAEIVSLEIEAEPANLLVPRCTATLASRKSMRVRPASHSNQ